MPTTNKHVGRQVIGPDRNPYMVRYILFRWAQLPRVYVHKFLRSDDERALHNHPWWFLSLVLRGSYLEYNDTPPNPKVRKRFSVGYRPLSTRHRVALPNGFNPDGSYGPQPCWTLVVTGPDVRGWGFWCREKLDEWSARSYAELDQVGVQSHVDRFVPWREFDGCGE